MRKTIARPYAKSLFLLSLDQDDINQSLHSWQQCLECLSFSINEIKSADPALLISSINTTQVVNILLSVLEKKSFLNAQSKFFVNILGNQKRLNVLPLIQVCFDELFYDYFKQKVVWLEAAFELSETDQLMVEEVLKKYISYQLKFKKKLNPNLLSGIRVRYDDYLVNMNLSNTLTAFRYALTKH